MPPNSMLLPRLSCFSQSDVPWIVVNFWLFSRVPNKFIFDDIFGQYSNCLYEGVVFFFFEILILSFLKKPVCFCHLFLIRYLLSY